MPVVPGGQTSSQLPECCRAHCADGATPTNSSAPDKAPCDSSKSCCTACKDRVLPSGTTVPTGDTIGVDLQVAAFILTDCLQYPPAAKPTLSAKRCTGPPGAPSGRAVLTQAGILLV